jgi:hypothetical protein
MNKNTIKQYEKLQIGKKIRELNEKTEFLDSNQISVIDRLEIKTNLTFAEKVLIFSLHDLIKLKEQAKNLQKIDDLSLLIDKNEYFPQGCWVVPSQIIRGWIGKNRN